MTTTANTGLSNEVKERIRLLEHQLNAELFNLANELSPGVALTASILRPNDKDRDGGNERPINNNSPTTKKNINQQPIKPAKKAKDLEKEIKILEQERKREIIYSYYMIQREKFKQQREEIIMQHSIDSRKRAEKLRTRNMEVDRPQTPSEKLKRTPLKRSDPPGKLKNHITQNWKGEWYRLVSEERKGITKQIEIPFVNLNLSNSKKPYLQKNAQKIKKLLVNTSQKKQGNLISGYPNLPCITKEIKMLYDDTVEIPGQSKSSKMSKEQFDTIIDMARMIEKAKIRSIQGFEGIAMKEIEEDKISVVEESSIIDDRIDQLNKSYGERNANHFVSNKFLPKVTPSEATALVDF